MVMIESTVAEPRVLLLAAEISADDGSGAELEIGS
jgi:hypothetical protein